MKENAKIQYIAGKGQQGFNFNTNYYSGRRFR